MTDFQILLTIAGIALFLLLVSNIKIISQGQFATLYRLGKFKKTLTPGVYLLIPFVDRIRYERPGLETTTTYPMV